MRPLAEPLACLALVLAATSVPALAKQPKENPFAATLPVEPVPPAGNGGIFQASMGYAPLHEGTRARRVGDPLTIRLTEVTTAAKSVGSKNDKGGNAGIIPPTEGLLSFLNPDALKAASSSSFKGQGDADQSSSLLATLSVTIAEVRPNGTALVRGEKQMLISQGEEWVRFSGIVRLIDIDQDNQLPSARVADARIEYSGRGALQAASRQGWLGRFFNLIAPF